MMALRILLFPFAVLYHAVTSVRNRMYDLGLKPSATFDLKIISVGNLAVGGTGKTPMIEHLIRMLKPDHKVATLSRGYGRSTRGIRIAGPKDDASTIGDEPYQFHKKYNDDVIISVGEERALAISYLLSEHPDVDVLLMDDAFQHRKVKPSFQILLTDYSRPFYKDLLLPAGRLRESGKGAQRANMVVVTKCPSELMEEEMMEIEEKIRKYTSRPVFFTSIHYGNIVPFNNTAVSETDRVILISGVANEKPLKNYVANNYKLIEHFNFPDHYKYDEKDLKDICALAKKNNAFVLTTEKDAAKLNAPRFETFISQVSFCYLPIEIEFLKNGEDFDEMVLNVVKNA